MDVLQRRRGRADDHDLARELRGADRPVETSANEYVGIVPVGPRKSISALAPSIGVPNRSPTSAGIVQARVLAA